MIDYDQILIDSTRTHRNRLSAAFIHGTQRDRRPVNNNLRRFTGSVILGAVACAACLATGFVLSVLQTQRETQAISAFRQVTAANPIQAGKGLVEDKDSGYLKETETGRLIDPRTGFSINPDTGLATDPQGRTVDPRTGWFIDPVTGYFTDPATGIMIDPRTAQVVDAAKNEKKR